MREEQNSNFLTRLHRGQLSIIPWPVIESRQFYSLFAVLKRQLEDKPPTYQEAGTFLHTLKVLMAKLKVRCCKTDINTIELLISWRQMIGDLFHVRKNQLSFFAGSTYIPWREHSITQGSTPLNASTPCSRLCCNWNWTRIWAATGQYLDIHRLIVEYSALNATTELWHECGHRYFWFVC